MRAALLPRRAALAAAGLLAAGKTAAADGASEWDTFKARFLHSDGRVIDTGNGGISHSEGQGWGLLFAEHLGDRAAFDRIWLWTDAHLRRSSDVLFSWRYDPASPTPVSDPNNATDGDLFIAMALSRAARRWNLASYAEQAAGIGRDVLRHLVRTIAGRTVLLPGREGFENSALVTLNPSYYVFSAFRELSERVDSPHWVALQRDGNALLREARFGTWRLVPDWLEIELASGRLAPARNWPPRSSYDAVRTPLYLRWDRQLDPDFRAFVATCHGAIPAWVDLITDEIAPYSGSVGFQAVALLASSEASTARLDDLPVVAAGKDYYEAALILLVRLVWAEAMS